MTQDPYLPSFLLSSAERRQKKHKREPNIGQQNLLPASLSLQHHSYRLQTEASVGTSTPSFATSSQEHRSSQVENSLQKSERQHCRAALGPLHLAALCFCSPSLGWRLLPLVTLSRLSLCSFLLFQCLLNSLY